MVKKYICGTADMAFFLGGKKSLNSRVEVDIKRAAAFVTEVMEEGLFEIGGKVVIPDVDGCDA